MFDTRYFVVMPIVEGEAEFAFCVKSDAQAYVSRIKASGNPGGRYDRVFIWNPEVKTLFVANGSVLCAAGNHNAFRKANEFEVRSFENFLNDWLQDNVVPYPDEHTL